MSTRSTAGPWWAVGAASTTSQKPERRARYGEVMRLYRGDGRRTTRYAPAQAVGPSRPHRAADRITFARKKWASAAPIPTDPEHPARRWLAARHLWRPDLQLPPSVRWLPAAFCVTLHQWRSQRQPECASTGRGVGPRASAGRADVRRSRPRTALRTARRTASTPRGGRWRRWVPCLQHLPAARGIEDDYSPQPVTSKVPS